jgi:hypothetical protein
MEKLASGGPETGARMKYTQPTQALSRRLGNQGFCGLLLNGLVRAVRVCCG